MRALFFAAALLGTAAQAQETLTFEADGDVIFARCTDAAYETICEMVFPAGTADEAYACVAINASGDPIGVVAAPTFMFPSGAWFHELPVDDIADVKCRKR